MWTGGTFLIQPRYADIAIRINFLQHVYASIRVKLDNACVCAPQAARCQITEEQKYLLKSTRPRGMVRMLYAQ